ncbi:MAG: protein kinase, partial [Myxococcota bacterium]|nr:protein kinase [Myxococcota bacterium]
MTTEGQDLDERNPGQDCLQPGQRIGSFRVVRAIGVGGMGTVYLAEHQQIGYRAAIKVLHREYSRHPEIARRFLNEARAVNIIQHPGIVKIFEFGELPDKTAYIIMEFLDGEVLGRRLERVGGRLGPGEALRIGWQLASALDAAHRRNVVHRDLKPGNIMLVPDPAAEGKERVKVLDFGLAKVAEGARESHPRMQTRTGVVLGTAMYMAPEQCRGARDVDGRADVYSLGVVLFEVLCGRPPFLAESEGELVTMQLRDDPPRLRELQPDVPEELAALVHRLLEKDPRRRPTMAQVADELERLWALYGPGSRPPLMAEAAPSATELVRPKKLQQRMRGRWLALGAAVGGLVGALLWAALDQPRPGALRGGGSWTHVPSGTEFHLRAVWRVGEDTLWAVGDQGTVLHGRGVRWTRVPSETTQGLRGV